MRKSNKNSGWWRWYARYLKSRKWRRIARKVRKRDKNKCRKCGRRGWIVHHLTYKRVGHERLSDLITICPRCHDKTHSN